MTEVLTSMCARLYGKRSARHRAEKAMAALHGEREVSS
jgi:putative resolvase